MRIVLDTNILLMSLPKISPYRIIFDALIAQSFQLCITTEILLEYIEKIEEKSSVTVAENVAKLLKTLENVHFQEIYYQWGLIENDPDDNKFVDCTFAANADLLVTNDGHFRVLKTIDFPKIVTVSADEFVEILQNIQI
jgi:uncharacterized protein